MVASETPSPYTFPMPVLGGLCPTISVTFQNCQSDIDTNFTLWLPRHAEVREEPGFHHYDTQFFTPAFKCGCWEQL